MMFSAFQTFGKLGALASSVAAPAPPTATDLLEDDGVTILYEDDGATALTED